jgi:hypothetical protein
MTIARWGRITPAQGAMLMLASNVLRRFSGPANDSDEDRLAAMKEGREMLVRSERCDLGYDLKAWHELLLERGDKSYRHPYGWSRVRKEIERAISDPDRVRLVALLPK